MTFTDEEKALLLELLKKVSFNIEGIDGAIKYRTIAQKIVESGKGEEVK